MGTFLKVGAFTPEFEENSHLNPRLAMPPEKRLITDMRSSSEKPTEQKKEDKPQPLEYVEKLEEDSDIEELTPEEIEFIRNRRRKQRGE